MANVITVKPSLLDTTGSSLKSTTLVGAFAEAMVLLLQGEKQYNLQNTLNPIGLPSLATNYATDSSSGVFSVPYNKEIDATGSINERGRDYLDGIFTWVGGTGDLADVVNLPDAVIFLAKRLQFFNSLIVPNVVIQNPAGVIVLDKNISGSAYNITVNLPTKTTVDSSDGSIDTQILNYLPVLDDQLGL
jgi:hypothetical protein